MNENDFSRRIMLAQNERESFSERLEKVERHVIFGEGGGGGGMETRIAKLESDVEHVKRDVSELRTDMRDVRDRMTRIETRVDHLPSKGFVVTSLVLSLAVIAALVTFQGNIQRLVGQTPSAISPVVPTVR